MIRFLRVSTEEQAHSGLGLDAQRDRIQRYADAHGWELIRFVSSNTTREPMHRLQTGASRPLRNEI
jgi:DNA invertase Pin-like site-specific DNA recombinase